jgi:hypothetical protein
MSMHAIPSALFCCDGASLPVAWRAAEWTHTHELNHLGTHPPLTLRIENLSHRLVGAVDGRALDLVRIAAYLYAADQLVSRGGQADVFGSRWQRRMALAIPVTDPACWNDPVIHEHLVRMLTFLTDDIWELSFSQAQDEARQLPLTMGTREVIGQPDSIVLFSGGADSLCATVELVLQQGRRPVLVSHRSNTVMQSRQTALASALRRVVSGWVFPHIGLVVNRRGDDAAETSQRTRAFLFAALGLAVSVSLGVPEVFFCDNGVVSINLPFTSGQFGAQATRSTHPRFIRELNELAVRLFPAAPQVRNSLASRTRADVLGILCATNTQDLLRHTASCAHPRGRTGDQRHCGVCSQCIDRRFATIAAGLQEFDPASDYEIDIFLDNLPQGVSRAMAVGYYNLALRLHETDSDQFLRRFPRLWDCLAHTGTSAEQSADMLTHLLKRHGDTVRKVMAQQIQMASPLIAERRLPRYSLIRLFQGNSGPASALPPASSTIATHPDSGRCVFRRAGEFYTLTFDGKTVNMGERDGLAYIHELLAHPATPFTASDLHERLGSRTSGVGSGLMLAAIDHDARAAGLRPATPATSDAVLDEQAKAEYRERLRELDDGIREAESNNDLERLHRAREEREFLRRQLSQAVGIGGRDRQTADRLKRPRQAVQKAISSVIRDLAKEHPPLAHHLKNNVKTGTTCVYEPEHLVRWDL